MSQCIYHKYPKQCIVNGYVILIR